MWKCPKCGDLDHLVISVQTSARLVQDGEEFETDVEGDVEWTPNSPCNCTACGWAGQLGEAEVVDGSMPEGPAEIQFTLDLRVHDAKAFRKAAQDRAMQDGLTVAEAAEYLDAGLKTLSECAVMLLDVGVSPDGSSIHGSSAEDQGECPL